MRLTKHSEKPCENFKKDEHLLNREVADASAYWTRMQNELPIQLFGESKKERSTRRMMGRIIYRLRDEFLKRPLNWFNQSAIIQQIRQRFKP